MAGCQIVWLAAVVATGFVANSPDAGLRWNEHYGRAKAAAEASKRPMVVVLENPSNVNESIDEEQLSEQDRARLRAKNFELCRVNVGTAYGKRVAEAFGAKTFPYTAVTDAQSKSIVFRKAGKMSELDWSTALAKSDATADSLATSQPRTVRKVVVEPVQRTPVTSFGGPVMITPSSAACFT